MAQKYNFANQRGIEYLNQSTGRDGGEMKMDHWLDQVLERLSQGILRTPLPAFHWNARILACGQASRLAARTREKMHECLGQVVDNPGPNTRLFMPFGPT